MCPSRLLAAFLVFMTSIIGFCVVGYLNILDLDYWLEDVSHCLPGTCRFQWNDKCLSCDNKDLAASVDHQPGDELLSRKARGAYAPPETKEKCEIINECLKMCDGNLVNICDQEHSDDRNDLVDQELDMDCESDETIVMGHAGGDPVNFCENTVEATVSGLLKGMEAVHIDVSFSQDQVPFLWRDHNPESLTARLRQIGVWGVARCRPSLAPHTMVPAHLLKWHDIETAWNYVDRKTGMYSHQQVVTFQEWIAELVIKVDISKLKTIWIEFRVPRELLRRAIYQIWEIAHDAGLEEKLWFEVMADGRVIFKKHLSMVGSVNPGFTIPLKESTNTRDRKVISSSQWFSLVHLLDQVQTREKEDNVFITTREDEVVYSVLAKAIPTTNREHFREEISTEFSSRGSSVKEVSVSITSAENISDTVQNILDNRNAVTRDSCNPDYSQVAVWTINKREEIEEMLCLKVDILITDYPSRVPKKFQCLSNVEPDLLARSSSLPFDCPEFCLRMYDPVCGSDGVTYSNECMMKDASCEEGAFIRVVSKGKCPEENIHERGFFTLDVKPAPTEAPATTTTEKTVREEKIDDCESFSCSTTSTTIPVCGTDLLTYESECFLEQAKCWGETVDVSKSGPCSADPCFNNCTDVLSPVCGTDGETYLNRCNLEKTACRKSKLNKTLNFSHKGSCSVDDSENDEEESGTEEVECQILCTRQFDPVCASDGKTYSNKCMMDFESCVNKSHLTVSFYGHCEDNNP